MGISISEVITALGGAILTLLLINSVNILANAQGFEALGSLFLLLYHGIGALILLPFLLRAYLKSEISRIFNIIVLLESLVNAFLVWSIALILMNDANIDISNLDDQTRQGFIVFIIAGVLELLPFLLYAFNRHKIQ